MKKLVLMTAILSSVAIAENNLVNLDYSYEQFKQDMEQNKKAVDKVALFVSRYVAETKGKQTTKFASLELEKEYQKYKENMQQGNIAIERAAEYAIKYNKQTKN